MKKSSRSDNAPLPSEPQDAPSVLIVGTGEGSLPLLRSLSPNTDALLLYGKGETAPQACGKCVAFDGDLRAFLHKKFPLSYKKRVHVVVNSGDGEENLRYCRQFAAFLQEQALPEKFLLSVFCESQKSEELYLLEEQTGGRIRCVDRCEISALDLENRYPLTSFLGERELDLAQAALRAEVRMNVVLVGFGRQNRQVFLSCVSSDRFFSRTQAGVREHPVRYFCFDAREGKESLADGFMRYAAFAEQIKGREAEYLPLPPLPAELHFSKAQAPSQDFFCELRAALQPKEGEIACNRVAVAVGSDEENLKTGRQIFEKLKEWDLQANTHVFVSARRATSPAEGLILFGKEETVYNFENICGGNALRMAWERHLAYTAEYNKGASEEEVRAAALSAWYGKGSKLSRDSSLYGCLSLRGKLHLFGFDYIEKESPLPDAGGEFYAAYTAGDAPRKAGKGADGRDVIEYRNADFAKDSPRRTVAMLEHDRWNAFMICRGYVPSSLQQIREGRGKDAAERRHGNLTDFEGLVAYRSVISGSRGIDEEKADVIRYDYQLTDDCGRLLSACGYKIVKRCPAADAAVRGEETP